MCPLITFVFHITVKAFFYCHSEQTVDQKKLEKAEAKIQKKQGKRTDLPKKPESEYVWHANTVEAP